jgi:hypothetical protein
VKDKKLLKKFFAFQLNECDAIKERLEEMALKGWKLKDVKTFFFFEKIEPQKLIYSVEVFDKASVFDTRPEPQTQEYIEYCYEAGWEFVCNFGKINIFVTTDENIVPIETDEELKFKTIKKGMLKQNFLLWFILPFLFLFNNLMAISNFEFYITSNLGLLNSLIMIIFLIIILAQITSYIVWCKKIKKRLSNGESLKYLNRIDLKRRSMFRLAPLAILSILGVLISIAGLLNADYFPAIMMLIIITIIILILVVSYFIQKKGLSRSANIVIPICLGLGISFLVLVITIFLVFNIKSPQGEFPLNTQDFGILSVQDISSDKHVESSIFAKNISCYFSTNTNSEDDTTNVSYSIFESNYSFICKQYLNSKIHGRYAIQYNKVDIPAWDAVCVYAPVNGNFDTVVVYKKYIFTYNANRPLTDDRIHAIVKKIKSIQK